MTIARVRTVFTGLAGTPWLGTAYFDSPALTDHQDLVDAVGTWWSVADGFMTGDVDWSTEAEVVELDEVTGEATGIFSTTPASGTGVQGGDNSPTLLQALARFRTGSFVDGREVRGRWFIPGLAESQLSNGVLLAATVTTLSTAAQAFVDTIGVSPVVWQRPRLADPLAEPPIDARPGSAHPMITGSVTNRFSPLRSRRD